MTSTRRNRSGLSLTEVAASSLLVGILIVGALNCGGALTRHRVTDLRRGKAEELAAQLMAEIVAQAYADPVESPLFGTEPSESPTKRELWDDVDDYNSWSASPPQDKAGLPLPDGTGWQRTVTVEWVTLSDPTTIAVKEEGLKRIHVTVSFNGTVLAETFALRTTGYGEQGGR